jgi:multidrug resistance efflux pump
MEVLLLGIYSGIVWLLVRFRIIPWTTPVKVTVVIIPIVALTVLILTLNVVAPSSAEVRVLKYTVQIVPQVRGRVLEVPAEGNRPMKKGDVLFRIDPTPYELQVKVLEAQLANAEGSAQKLREELRTASGQTAAVRAQLELARKRVEQHRELVQRGAGDRFALEQAEADQRKLQAQLLSAQATEGQVQAKLSAVVDDDQAEVAQIRAQLENARWELSQTVVYAPADGSAINVQLRPGSMVVGVPLAPAMTFVEDQYQIIALYHQNELHQVEPGNEAEITLKTLPGKILKARVDSIVWAQGQGQLAPSGMVPQTGVAPLPDSRFAVKFDLAEKSRDVFLAAGAGGDAAIYTNHAYAIHIIRKVILRVGSYLNYIIPKLH